ncbi:glucose-1-phosphate adenylyltransferase [Paenibacillus senegalensis]|uniref:glucose-1-phosphate adenylyltransferase n=1 Tax=Paenibacillus senegalensis TaxID=1465766 RepID=UPI0002D6D5EF|nr:glucose-1-phosphate adenylyltransferase [Paenibacillus senegalensis]
MKRRECVAMLLAGGEGRRLGVLTSHVAKPAVSFGGRYRIIDFALSNCTNSGLQSVGVLTQYKYESLHSHIGDGSSWKLWEEDGGEISLLAADGRNCSAYEGTADAIAKNIDYLEKRKPEHVLILSGDHIYRMDYRPMLEWHKQTNADVTIAVREVPWDEASRFGIMATGSGERIVHFEEKPEEPQSNLASMGIYIFKWEVLKRVLLADRKQPYSSHDFGKDIIPAMLASDARLYAYPFEGYWKDVGTVDSLWDAHMDLLNGSLFSMNQEGWPLYTNGTREAPQYIAPSAIVRRSLIHSGCGIHGRINRSVLSCGTEVGEDSVIKHSVIMPNVKIGRNVKIYKAIIGEGTVIRDGSVIGEPEEESITVVGAQQVIYRENEKKSGLFVPRSQLALERIG